MKLPPTVGLMMTEGDTRHQQNRARQTLLTMAAASTAHSVACVRFRLRDLATQQLTPFAARCLLRKGKTTSTSLWETGKQLRGYDGLSEPQGIFIKVCVCVFHYLFYGLISRHNKSAFLLKLSLFYLQTFIPPHPFSVFLQNPDNRFPCHSE